MGDLRTCTHNWDKKYGNSTRFLSVCAVVAGRSISMCGGAAGGRGEVYGAAAHHSPFSIRYWSRKGEPEILGLHHCVFVCPLSVFFFSGSSSEALLISAFRP